MKRKFTSKEKIALTVLIALMAAVIGVGAYLIIDNVNKANTEATNTTHTTVKIETTAAPETTAEIAATEKSAPKAAKKNSDSKASKADKNTSKADKKTGSKTSSKTKSKTQSENTSSKKLPKVVDVNNDEGKVSVVTPETNKTHKSGAKCVINGVTCYVGDTISVTLNLKYSKTLVNYQGYTTFDSDYLKFKSVKPNLGVANNKGNAIYYNASVISGLDFSSEGTIYTAQFTVKKAGKAEIKNTFELLTDTNDKDVSPSSVKDSIKVFS